MALSAVTNIAYPPTAGGVAGSTITYTNGAATWSQPHSHFNDGSTAVMSIPNGGKTVILEEKATLEVKGNVKINGVDLEERLTTIEKVLNIPQRDVTIETKYPKLADLYQQYMHELEKYKTFERLKGDENTTTS